MTVRVVDIPHWAEMMTALRNRESVISHAPRHSLQPMMLRCLRDSYPELGATAFIAIQPDEFVRGSQVDWNGCAATFARQWRVPRPDVRDAGEFRNQLLNWMDAAAGGYVIVVVGIGAPSSVEGRFELISELHYALSDVDRQSALTVAVLDDYTLYYYETWRTQGVSRWDYLQRIHFRPMDAEEILGVLRRGIPSAEPEFLTKAAAEIEKATGGHVGLAADACESLIQQKGTIPASYWRKAMPRLLAGSHVMESLRRSLQEDALGLTQRALEYEQPKVVTRDQHSQTVQTLRSLGILQWTSLARARLCPGAIRDLVKDVRESAADEEIVGTVVRDSGASVYVPRSLKISDDDISVLHISDIHLGEYYAFRIGQHAGRHDRRSAAEMLADDMKSAGANHVDAVVFSGDFTETAELGEFRRAREVLGEVLTATGSSWDRAIVVAGNHDVRWLNGGTSSEHSTRVSREEFATFRELIGKSADPLVDVMLVVSRSGKNALRIVALDTNLVEGPNAGGIGYISLETLQSVQPRLAELVIPSSVERVSTWVVVHHHVFPATSALVSDAERRKVSVMANAQALLSFAVSWDTEMILHGHEHQPSVTIAKRWPMDRGRALAPLCVAGAGSFGCKREWLGPFARNHYFLHVRRQHDILVRSRMTGDEGLGWTAHGDLSIPVSNATGADDRSPRPANPERP